MKKPLLLCLLLLLTGGAIGQYWQQQVDFTIDVKLNTAQKSLDAFERITYRNNSPDTLFFIWFHLWPNAYKNDRTAFTEQELRNGNTSFYFSNEDERGYINRLDFKSDGVTLRTEDHPQHIDIIKVLLQEPLPPGAQTVITTPFHVQLPAFFSRSGHAKGAFYVTQWFPKPAVYDHKGWHPMPYLDLGEYYSNFGSYDVRITVPQNFEVAATGVKKEEQLTAEGKTYRFAQERVHDFAWFADSSFRVDSDTAVLTSGKTITVLSYYRPGHPKMYRKVLQYAKDALRFYSKEVGEYPYSTVSIVQGPEQFSGGMEYPTITLIEPLDDEKLLDQVVAHEVGHNWFQGILASNERDHPWMDEGLNSYFETRYYSKKYRKPSAGTELLFQTRAKRKKDQPIATTSEPLDYYNYALIPYHKAATWLQLMEKDFGEDSLLAAFRSYYQQWQFRHPYPEDLQASFAQSLGNNIEDRFALLHTRGVLPGKSLKGFQVVSPFIKGSIRGFFREPAKDILWLSPAIGGNNYDKFMIGVLATNYKLPPNRLHYLLAPMYATGSKKITGLARIKYTSMHDKAIRKLDLFLNASHFTMNSFEDSAGKKYFMPFTKLAPGFRLTFKQQDPKSTITKYVQWKTFLIRETGLRAERDTIFNGADTIPFLRYLLPENNRYLNQFLFVLENNRALYPFSVNLQVEQSTDFLRPALEANYYFNYREGGLQARFFAGSFFYIGEKNISKQFRNDRYHLNMTGAKGYEDYTYSTYFLGRNDFEGFRSQQIMMRDGGFKVRTDLLANKIGKTDQWLLAINLNSSLPSRINPLSVLPVKIPLRVFMDIGTYAEAWEKDADRDRFLYDIGLHIPIFHESINIYFPLFYNKSYGDYFKSTIPKNRFFQTMSFTINLYNRELKKLNREIEF